MIALKSSGEEGERQSENFFQIPRRYVIGSRAKEDTASIPSTCLSAEYL
jgi:hypothetical protein